ncbi:MAG: HPP family protein [Woeseia sp.]
MSRLIERLGLENRLRRENISRYSLQCGLAGIVVLALLLVLDAVTQTVLIAAFGASAFIAFAVPRSLHSGPRNMIGGYLVGIVAGTLMGAVGALFRLSDPIIAHTVMVLFGALATAIAMFFMVITKTEHPPAAALALGLVLNEWDLLTLVVVIIGIVALSIIKRLVLPLLMDLL